MTRRPDLLPIIRVIFPPEALAAAVAAAWPWFGWEPPWLRYTFGAFYASIAIAAAAILWFGFPVPIPARPAVNGAQKQ